MNTLERCLEDFCMGTGAEYAAVISVADGRFREIARFGPAGTYSPSIIRRALKIREPLRHTVGDTDHTALSVGAGFVYAYALSDRELLYVWTAASTGPDPHLLSVLAIAISAVLRTDGLEAGLASVTRAAVRELPDSTRIIPTESGPFVYRSRAMHECIELVRMFAETDDAVFITGPTGTGKTMLARIVHALSGRRGAFVHTSASERPGTLFHAAIFGARPGAYTGAPPEDQEGFIERARGGTLFIDEIGDADDRTQAALLRVMETGTYYPLGATEPIRTDARFILATARSENVRPELRFRCPYTVRMPPLRERPEDIAPAFIVHAGMPLTDDAERLIESSDWPGNLRQLAAVARAAAIIARKTHRRNITADIVRRALEITTGDDDNARRT